MGSIAEKIQKSIDRYVDNNDRDPSVILMDSVSYFELKLSEFGDAEAAIEEELETFLGLRIFYANLGYDYIDVAG